MSKHYENKFDRLISNKRIPALSKKKKNYSSSKQWTPLLTVNWETILSSDNFSTLKPRWDSSDKRKVSSGRHKGGSFIRRKYKAKRGDPWSLIKFSIES